MKYPTLARGSTVLLELSQGLCHAQHDEKNIIENMFLRESSRDRSLVQRAKERKQKGRKKSVSQGRGNTHHTPCVGAARSRCPRGAGTRTWAPLTRRS